MPCTNCGYCCKNVHHYWPNTPETMEFIRVRGYKVVQSSDKVIETRLRLRCKHLDINNQCRIHDSKPLACQLYPTDTGHASLGLDPQKSLGKKCGYKWNGTAYD